MRDRRHLRGAGEPLRRRPERPNTAAANDNRHHTIVIIISSSSIISSIMIRRRLERPGHHGAHRPDGVGVHEDAGLLRRLPRPRGYISIML